jgi:hypothetical protein
VGTTKREVQGLNRPGPTGTNGGTASGPRVIQRAVFAGAFLVTAIAGISVARGGDPGLDPPGPGRSDRASGTTEDDRRPGAFDPNEPLGSGGKKVSVEEAEQDSPVPVFRPQGSTDSDVTVTGVWVREEGIPEVFIRYASNAEVSVRRAEFSKGFLAFYQGEIADGYPGYLTRIDDVDVFMDPGDAEGSTPGADLVMDGYLVEIVGHGSVTFDEVQEDVRSIIEHAAEVPEPALP